MDLARDFNKQYGKKVDEFIVERELETTKRAPIYRIPPEVIEFINAVGYVIHKPFAFPLKIYINKCKCMYIFRRPDLENCLDWVYFIGDDTHSKQFYINCNPESRQYGNITHIDCSHIYPNLREFIKDIELWMGERIKEPWTEKDIRIQKFLNERLDESSSATNRDVLIDPYVLPYGYTSCTIIANNLKEDFTNTIIFPNYYNNNHEIAVIFQSWFCPRHNRSLKN